LNFNHFRLIFGTKKKQKFFGLYNQKQVSLNSFLRRPPGDLSPSDHAHEMGENELAVQAFPHPAWLSQGSTLLDKMIIFR